MNYLGLADKTEIAGYAQYDDTHPWEALEIICSLIGMKAESKYVDFLGQCISNSYEYMALSLDRCMQQVRR